jgi:signal transduction histidine kinase
MPSEPRDDLYVRTTFLERLAHELRGPAGVTSGALDQMERTLRLGDADPKLVAQFAMARRGVSRVVRVAERLHRAAQLERGSAPFALVRSDVRGIAESAARAAQVIDARRNVEVVVLASDEPCLAAVDMGWLLNAIGEVLANAIRFARARVTIDTRAVDREIRVTVSDDGPGFSAEPRRGRFEPLGDSGGLGLSLPLVREVLEAHGGRLEIGERSGNGDGTGARVLLVLPSSQVHE